MAPRLTLICHAPVAVPRAAGFPLDEPADPVALAEVPKLARGLGRFARLWTAPELRARQTADTLGSGATVVPDLRDCNYGSWRGRSLVDINRNDPEGASSWLADAGAAPHGGESIVDLLHRVGSWLSDIQDADHTIAVTHPAVIRAAIVHILGAPAEAFWRIDIEPLAVTDLRRNARRWTLRSVGRTMCLV